MSLDRFRAIVRRATSSLHSETAPQGARGLEVVYEPKAGSKDVIDIVAVHGLARGFQSWTWPKNNGRSWLVHPFPQDLAEAGYDARVMTFSYDPEALDLQVLVRKVLYGRALDLVQQLQCKRNTEDTISRPLVFIAHSMGGLIVKRAMIISCENEIYRTIELSTVGIAFFGTPDTSIPAASLEIIIRKVAKLSPSHKELLKEDRESVRNDALWLKMEMEEFKPISSTLTILSFYEELKTPLTKGTFKPGRIVDEHEVTRPTTGHREAPDPQDPGKIGLKKRHTGLIRFTGRNDDGYDVFVKRFVRQVLAPAHRKAHDKQEQYESAMSIRKGTHDVTLTTGTVMVPSVIPDGAKLVTRVHLVERLGLEIQGHITGGGIPIVAVTGPRGVGKTTLVRTYSYNARNAGRFVFWLNAESRETIITSFLQLAQHIFSTYWKRQQGRHSARDTQRFRAQLRAELGFPDVEKLLQTRDFHAMEPIKAEAAVRAVKDWLLRGGNPWLLVYENVNGWATNGPESFDLMQYLLVALHGQTILITDEHERCPWSGLEFPVPEWTEDAGAELLIRLSGVADTPANLSTAKAISLALHCDPLSISCAATYIAQKDSERALAAYLENLQRQTFSLDRCSTAHSKLAMQILSVSTMLSTQAIPVELFRGTLLGEAATSGIEQIGDDRSVIDIVSHLEDENFLQRLPSEEVQSRAEQSHRPFLLLEPARGWVKRNFLSNETEVSKTALLACSYCVQVIKSQWLENYLPRVQAFGRLILPHAEKCYDLSGLLSQDARETIEWQVLGNVCMTQGATDIAIGCFNLAIHNKGLKSTDRTEAHLSLATIYYERGDLVKCRATLAQINISGSHKPTLLDFRVHFALAEVAAHDNEEIEDAAEQFDRLEEEQCASAGPTDSKTLQAVLRLASVLTSLGRLQRAQALYRRALTSCKIEYGANDPATLDVMEELAYVLELRGSIDQAEKLYLEAVEARAAMLGRDHPSTAVSRARLASLYDSKYDFDKAGELYNEAEEDLRNKLGPLHPTYVTILERHALSIWAGAAIADTTDERHDALREAEEMLKDIKEKKRHGVPFKLFSEKQLGETRKRLGDLRRDIADVAGNGSDAGGYLPSDNDSDTETTGQPHVARRYSSGDEAMRKLSSSKEKKALSW